MSSLYKGIIHEAAAYQAATDTSAGCVAVLYMRVSHAIQTRLTVLSVRMRRFHINNDTDSGDDVPAYRLLGAGAVR